jgi:tetratricopeptide (TPR) repeat protein
MKYLYLVKNHKLFIFFIFLIVSTSVTSQITLDSIEKIRETIKNPAKRLHMEMYLAEEFIDVDLSKSDKYFKIVELKLDTIKPIYVLRYHLAMSIKARIEGNPDDGIVAANRALEFANTYKDSIKYKAKIYNSLGSLYDDKSDIPKAIENHLIALRYAESIDYKAQVATICNGIGRAYLYLSEYDKAKEYYEKAIKIKELLGQFDISLATSYQNLSNCYDAQKDYKKSLFYLDKAIEIRKTHNNYIHLTSTYNNKAFTLFLMKRYNEAEKIAETSIQLADSLKVFNEKMYSLSTYAEILFAQNKVKQAEKAMEESIGLSKKNNDLYLIKYNLDLMYDINVQKGNYKKALDYFKQKSVVLDSVNSISSRKEVEKLALEYETEKKNGEIDLLNKEKTFSKIELKKSRQLQITLLVVALLLIAVIGLLRSRHKNKIKTNKLLKDAMEQSFEKKLADSELQALRAQMNPHFLFNCLNSINSFIIKNNQEKASEYLTKFSKLIRRVLSNSKEKKVTLSNELEALELYIEMEALRFNDKFQYELNIDKDLEVDYIEVPPLIIQPYVENSIWHGLMHKSDKDGKLAIKITQEKNVLIYVIEDNGIGREASAKIKSKSAERQKSFGMSITKERLKYTNNKKNETTNIVVEDLKDSEGNVAGTRVTIKIQL